MTELRFFDQEWDWRSDNLYSFLYLEGNIPQGYFDFFNKEEIVKEIKKISDYLSDRSQKTTIYPKMAQVFRCLSSPDPKVCIVGQDPYHDGAAVGLCFSISPSSKYINPSFRSIQKELVSSGYKVNNSSGDISHWSTQGVILLNSALTVEKSNPGSHSEIWSIVTDKLIEFISSRYSIAWLLWGKDAQSYSSSINDKERHFVFKSSHPMPLAASKSIGGNPAFLGSDCFNKTNQWLASKDKKEIDWSIA